MAKRQVPKRLVVHVDEREKLPLVFPYQFLWYEDPAHPHQFDVKTKRVLMPTGDYCIEGHPKSCLIERKGSIAELEMNLLTNDKKRVMDQLRRMDEESRHPYLLLDVSLGSSLTTTYSGACPSLIMDEFFREMHKTKMKLLWVSGGQSGVSRMLLGTQVLRLMWNHVWQDLQTGA